MVGLLQKKVVGFTFSDKVFSARRWAKSSGVMYIGLGCRYVGVGDGDAGDGGDVVMVMVMMMMMMMSV